MQRKARKGKKKGKKEGKITNGTLEIKETHPIQSEQHLQPPHFALMFK